MNASERQMIEFVNFKKHGNFQIKAKLTPQGDETIIKREAVNLCRVMVGKNAYYFGGISESVYDEMISNEFGYDEY